MNNVRSKTVVLGLVASLLISGQITNTIYAKQPPEMRKAEVVYDDGKFGMMRVPMYGNKKDESSKKAVTGNTKHNNRLKSSMPHSLKPVLPPGVKPALKSVLPPGMKPGAPPLEKLGISPLYTDNDGGYYSYGDITVYAAYTSYTGAESKKGNTYWPTLEGNKVYIYTAFHSDTATTVNIYWDLNWYDEIDGYQSDSATWDYNGQTLDPNYWYYAFYHPDNALSSGYYSVYAQVTSQTAKNTEYCYPECYDYDGDGDYDGYYYCDYYYYGWENCYTMEECWDYNGDGDNYDENGNVDQYCYTYTTYDYDSANCEFRVND